MSRPWMPLYVADYLRDTRMLTAAEHGAYLLLIMEYWTAGKLPDDDKQLCRIACMSPAEWRKAKPNIQPYFSEGWKGHKRIDAELAKSAEISSKRSASAKLKHSNRSAIAEQVDTHAGATSQSQSQLQSENKNSEPVGSGAEAPPDPSEPERQLFARGREVLGKSAGGQIAKLFNVCGHNVALARSKIELAATKQIPAEFIAGVIRAGPVSQPARPLTQHQIERQESREILNDLQKFIDGSSGGGDADPGILRLNPGDGQEIVHGGVRRIALDLPASRSRPGG